LIVVDSVRWIDIALIKVIFGLELLLANHEINGLQ
jgi:hypothetical protein